MCELPRATRACVLPRVSHAYNGVWSREGRGKESKRWLKARSQWLHQWARRLQTASLFLIRLGVTQVSGLLRLALLFIKLFWGKVDIQLRFICLYYLSGSPDKLSLWLLITRPILSGVCRWQSTVRTQRWTGLLGCLSSQPDLGSLCLFLQSSISLTALVAWSLCRPCQLARVNFCLLVHSGIEDIHPQLMTRKE